MDEKLEGNDAKEILKVIGEYSKALDLLDDYDHKTIKKQKGNNSNKKIEYEECLNIINTLKFNENSNLFALERDKGLKSIIADIYQTFDNKDVYETMLITKENYTIYRLFEELIREIQTCEVYKPEEIVLEPTFADEFYVCDVFDVDPFSLSEEDEQSLTEAYRRTKAKEANERIKKTTKYDLLTKDNSITWYSDDASIEAADVVRLSIVEEGILLEFTRPDLDPAKDQFCYPGLLNIRFSNSGSRYDELVNIFNRMYQKLQEYEPVYHQIHLEELDYQKRLLIEKKSLEKTEYHIIHEVGSL